MAAAIVRDDPWCYARRGGGRTDVFRPARSRFGFLRAQASARWVASSAFILWRGVSNIFAPVPPVAMCEDFLRRARTPDKKQRRPSGADEPDCRALCAHLQTGVIPSPAPMAVFLVSFLFFFNQTERRTRWWPPDHRGALFVASLPWRSRSRLHRTSSRLRMDHPQRAKILEGSEFEDYGAIMLRLLRGFRTLPVAHWRHVL